MCQDSVDQCPPEASRIAELKRTSDEDMGMWQCLKENLQK